MMGAPWFQIQEMAETLELVALSANFELYGHLSTVRELQGFACTTLETEPPPKKEIACTRSFGHPVLQLGELTEAVTEFACRAAQKLRAQASHTGQVLCFVRTSPFRQKDPQYSRSIIVPLRKPTSDSAQITLAAVAGLNLIYQPGYKYAKAGVMLLDLQDELLGQQELDLDPEPIDRGRLMGAMDRLNARYGRGTLATNYRYRSVELRIDRFDTKN